MSVQKILCIFHNEQTPSMAIYSNGYHCYGCGASGPLSDLPNYEVLRPKKKVIENLTESLDYVNSLPTKLIRGLELHYDQSGFYILWEGGTYYKKRLWDDARGKYRCPSGHNKPSFWLLRGYRKDPLREAISRHALIVVEGEINALSIAETSIEADIVSPGGVSEFEGFSSEVSGYNRVLVIADEDAPGMNAAFELEYTLIEAGVNASSYLMRRDANEVLVTNGKEALQDEIETALDMSGRLQGH